MISLGLRGRKTGGGKGKGFAAYKYILCHGILMSSVLGRETEKASVEPVYSDVNSYKS